tara:strand:+ start:191 stop:1807 length:1617 start_codon:yes stop_codon:yes gene_type:complete
MAKPINVEAKVVAEVEDAKQNIKEVGDEIDSLKRKSRSAAKDGSKEFGNFANLFSGLLPRNIQMMIRKFQSTQRAVGRLGRSLKFLKGAFAGLGIGLLIIALESLIDNWEKISNLLTGVDEKQEAYNQRIEQGTKSVTAYVTANQQYINTINDTTASADLRNQALATMGARLREVQNLDISTAEGVERFNLAIERQLGLERLQAEQQQILQRIGEKRNEDAEEELSFLDILLSKKARAKIVSDKQADIDEEINDLKSDFNSLILQQLAIEAKRTAELERQNIAATEQRRLEALRLKFGEEYERQLRREDEAEAAGEDDFDPMLQFDIDQAKEQSKREHYERSLDDLEAFLEEQTQMMLDADRTINDAQDKTNRDNIKGIQLEGAARQAKFRAALDIANHLERLAKEGSEAQKAFAITSVLLSQAQAISSAITSATIAAAAAGPLAPIVTPVLIAQMVGIVLGGFAQVKSLLNQAGASTGGIGRGGGGGSRGGMTGALVPQMNNDRQLSLPHGNQAFIVQSELQGQMQTQGALEKRLHL